MARRLPVTHLNATQVTVTRRLPVTHIDAAQVTVTGRLPVTLFEAAQAWARAVARESLSTGRHRAWMGLP